jgi:hypothetical protein
MVYPPNVTGVRRQDTDIAERDAEVSLPRPDPPELR